MGFHSSCWSANLIVKHELEWTKRLETLAKSIEHWLSSPVESFSSQCFLYLLYLLQRTSADTLVIERLFYSKVSS